MPSANRAARQGRQRWPAGIAIVGGIASVALAAGWLVGGSEATSVAEQPVAAISSAPSTQLPTQVRQRALDRKTPMDRSVPVRVRVPAIGVDSRLIALGLLSDGTLQTPPSASPAGWFTGAPTPGELGPAVIVGHVRYGRAGVFARLAEVRDDDEIHIERTDGTTATFRVTRVNRFAKASFPTQQVYGDIPYAGLRLITCAGLDPATGEFEDNVVIFAELVSR